MSAQVHIDLKNAIAGVRQHPAGWEGVIRVGGDVVWACGHGHRNRDISSRRCGRAASNCSEVELSTRNGPQPPRGGLFFPTP